MYTKHIGLYDQINAGNNMFEKNNVYPFRSHAWVRLVLSIIKTATPTYICVVFPLNYVANCSATPNKLFPVMKSDKEIIIFILKGPGHSYGVVS